MGNGKGATVIADTDREALEKEFNIGKATWEDVIEKLGPPTERSELAGYEVWQYQYHKDMDLVFAWYISSKRRTKTALFYFDPKSGVLGRVDYRESSQ